MFKPFSHAVLAYYLPDGPPVIYVHYNRHLKDTVCIRPYFQLHIFAQDSRAKSFTHKNLRIPKVSKDRIFAYLVDSQISWSL
jgi:hypothetical protein